MTSPFDTAFRDFQEQVVAAEVRHKIPSLFWRNKESQNDELCILRRWNSHSPSITDVFGGGYFLRWKGKGTIIDPGCTFLKIFRDYTDYSFRDIDMVIVTHDHDDHCHDLAPLLGLFRLFNKWLQKTKKETKEETPRVWDMLLSYGVADRLSTVLNHRENVHSLILHRILLEENIDTKKIPDFLTGKFSRALLLKHPCLNGFINRAGEEFSNEYQYNLFAIRAKHNEIHGAQTAFGVRFELLHSLSPPPLCRNIVISGDTALEESKILERYAPADLLILHVGSMVTSPKGGHLCFEGVQTILQTLHKSTNKPKLVILTEWGYEFGRIGLNGRTQFTRLLVDKLNLENHGFHAAVADNNGEAPDGPNPGDVIILPADLGLRIELPSLNIFAADENNNNNQGFHNYREVYARESGEEIKYLR